MLKKVFVAFFAIIINISAGEKIPNDVIKFIKNFHDGKVEIILKSVAKDAIKEDQQEGSGIKFAKNWSGEMRRVKEKKGQIKIKKNILLTNENRTKHENAYTGIKKDSFKLSLAKGTFGVVTEVHVKTKTKEKTLLMYWVFRKVGNKHELIYIADD